MKRKKQLTKNKKQKKHTLEGSKSPFSFKKHILPPMAGLLVFTMFIAAFNSQRIIGLFYEINLNSDADEFNLQLEKKAVDASAKPKIYINKVSITAPVNFEQDIVDEDRFQFALRDGVVHYPGTANPGETGNVVIFGHSSNSIWAKGNYKDVFAPLHGLEADNKIYIEYLGTRYIYKVVKKYNVDPDEISVLQHSNTKKLTLITCTPIGTNDQRLIVEAEQIAPVYTVDEADDSIQKVPTEIDNLPSSSPSFWESITSIL